MPSDKKILLEAGDGPESIEIYTSEDEGDIDWASARPAAYVLISINGAYAKFGPFSLPSIYQQLASQIKAK